MPSSEITWHEKLGSAFLKARDLDEPGRRAFLRDLSGSDAEMASWVERMLAAEEKSSPILEGSSRGPLLRLALPDISGTRVGQYTIVRRIGAGGMGAVYEATQDKPQRSVAVKVLPGGLGSHAARRFEFESETLARLRHPSIAQVYEAGIHEEAGAGFPYFAMEYVPDAQSITAYARDRRLSLRAKVRLFIAVCAGVHHGHQRGVIHRDLKPDNILVDASGAPKIIDFGVARASHMDAAMVTVQTEAGQLVGTVPYMSPEQVSGAPGDLDTRTDIYSLGVVLFEMLAGRLPYDLTGASLVEAIRTIQEAPPARLRALDPAIPADLATIVEKALSKDREQRYAFAADLAADLERFLRDEPIAARPPSWGYQFRKFARRNKVLVGAAAALLLALTGGVVAERLRANEAVRAREDAVAAQSEAVAAQHSAEVEAERATRVIDFLNDMLSQVTPDEAKGESVTVQEVLDAVAEDIDVELADAPEVEATIRYIVGMTYHAQGLYPQAKEMLTEAATIHETLGLRNKETAEILGYLASSHLEMTELDEAAATYEKALAVAREATGPNSDTVLWLHTDRGEVVYMRGQFEAVADTLREIVRIRLERNGESDKEVHTNRANLAIVLEQMGRYDEAMELLKQSLAWYRENLGEAHSLTLAAMQSLARLEHTLGNYEEGYRMYEDVIERYREHFGPDHPALGSVLFQYGAALNKNRENAAAEERLRESLAIHEKVYGADHVAVARVLGRLAAAISGQGRREEALAMQDRALKLYRDAGQTDTVSCAWAMHEYAIALLNAKRCEDAQTAQQQAVAILTNIFGEDSDRTLTGRHVLALIETRCGDLQTGIEMTRQVLADRERLLAADHPDIAISKFNLGRAYLDAGRFDESLPLMLETAEYYAGPPAPNAKLRAQALTDAAMMQLTAGDAAKAEEYARTAAEWMAANSAPDDPPAFVPRRRWRSSSCSWAS